MVADDFVGGSFDAVGVVAGAFDGSGTGAVSALRQWAVQDFGVGLVDGLGQVFRGKWPPGQ